MEYKWVDVRTGKENLMYFHSRTMLKASYFSKIREKKNNIKYIKYLSWIVFHTILQLVTTLEQNKKQTEVNTQPIE